jgi:hypothetical protein
MSSGDSSSERESHTIHTSQGDLYYGSKRDGSGHWWSGILGGEKYSGQNATRPRPDGKLDIYAHQPSHDSPARGHSGVDPHTGKADKSY